jgi:hypothetical protein
MNVRMKLVSREREREREKGKDNTYQEGGGSRQSF